MIMVAGGSRIDVHPAIGVSVPRKIRELIKDLKRAGFTDRGGKGSHRNFKHPGGSRVTVSGSLGEDAKGYQERDVAQAIRESNQ